MKALTRTGSFEMSYFKKHSTLGKLKIEVLVFSWASQVACHEENLGKVFTVVGQLIFCLFQGVVRIILRMFPVITFG